MLPIFYLDIPWKYHGPNNTIDTGTKNMEINVCYTSNWNFLQCLISIIVDLNIQ